MAFQRSWFRQRLVLTSLAATVAFTVFTLLSSCGESAQNPVATKTTDGKIDPAFVKSLYSAKCGICHGADGAMNYAGAKDLSISTLPKAEIIAQITYGKGTMPPMEKQLTAEQIEAVADYCILLRKK